MSEPLQGAMLEADFEKGTITFQMHGEYWARAGTYIILPLEEYRKLTATVDCSMIDIDTLKKRKST